MTPDLGGLLEEQLRYYRERVDEYDEMLAEGDRFTHADAGVGAILRKLESLGPLGDVLELAAGTGLWTGRLAERATSVTAVDGAPESRYDLVFFGFWLSHVPRQRLEAFWSMVAGALAPGGRFFCVDTQWDPDAVHATGPSVSRTRRDGRVFRLVKVLYQPDELAAFLRERGWDVEAHAVDSEFFHASGRPAGS